MFIDLGKRSGTAKSRLVEAGEMLRTAPLVTLLLSRSRVKEQIGKRSASPQTHAL